MQSSSEPATTERDSQSERPVDAAHRRCYHPAAARDAQPAITRLIPHRLLTQFVLAGLGLAVSLLLIDGWILQMEAPSSWPVPRALDPNTPGSLAGWAIGLACLGAAVAMLLVYSVRRHRVDDYRGRYRLWLWAAAGCILASADATTCLSQQLADMAASTTAIAPPVPALVAQAWPLLLAALLGLFLVWELLESPVATFWLGAAAASTIAGTLLTTEAMALADPLLHQLAQFSLRLASVWCLLGGICWYARHVDRIANDLVPRKTPTETEPEKNPKSKSLRRGRSKADTGTASGEKQDSGEEPLPPQPNRRRRGKKPSAPAKTVAADDDQAPAKPLKPSRQRTKPTPPQPVSRGENEEDEMAGLSKAERRRLRKQKRREARRNAA